MFPQKTGTDYQVDLTAPEDIKEEGYFPGRVLTIPVEMDNVIIASADSIKKPGLAGGAITKIKTMADNNSSSSPCRFNRIVAGTIINHQNIHIRVETPYLQYQLPDTPGFIKYRDQNQYLIL